MKTIEKKSARKEKKRFWGLTCPRLVLCCLLLIAMIANMVLVFMFSAENKEDSGDRSRGMTEAVVKVIVKDYDTLPPTEQEKTLETFHRPIRKIAHFCEFGLLGFLCGAFQQALGKGRSRVRWAFPAAFCLLYAISDEVHQIFSGRGPAITDVLIDFAGSMTGICTIHLILLVAGLIIKKRKAKRICESPVTP